MCATTHTYTCTRNTRCAGETPSQHLPMSLAIVVCSSMGPHVATEEKGVERKGAVWPRQLRCDERSQASRGPTDVFGLAPTLSTLLHTPTTHAAALALQSFSAQTLHTHTCVRYIETRTLRECGSSVSELRVTQGVELFLTSPATDTAAPKAQPLYTVPSWSISFAVRREPGVGAVATAAFFSFGECMTRMCVHSLALWWCLTRTGPHHTHEGMN